MADVVLVIVVCLVLAFNVLWILALVSAIRLPPYAWKAARRSKTATIFLIVLTGGFGGWLFWFRIRPQVLAARERVAPPPPPRKPDPWSSNWDLG